MRRRISLMEEWQFTKNGQQENINLPHTWNSTDGQDGGNDYYRGECCYEKSLKRPLYDPENEEVYLEFEGVNASARVILNTRELIMHDGGYSTFRARAGEFLQEDNRLQVIVDNSVNDRVYPQKADFTFYGGIYRDVNWLIVNKSHFAVEDWGTPGAYVSTRVISDKESMVGIRVLLETEGNGEDLTVQVAVVDAEGKSIAFASAETEAGAKSLSLEMPVDNPHLWNGVEDPYMYTAVCRLCAGSAILDEIQIPFGIRTISFDKNKGFFLNGRQLTLKGVSRHQDRRGIGNALTTEMMDEDMALIKEMGANSIRLAHYQHNRYFYDLCDREGMLVWAEIPYISGYLSNGDENTYNQMVELIMQNYNHPSIVTWGISNEITIDNLHSRGRNIKNHKRLNELVHSLDPDRPTTLACYAMCTPFHPVTRIPDIIGWNLYLGWYVPGKFLNDVFMWFYHTFFKKPLCYSEYGAEGMPNLHSKHPRRGDHSEEYQAVYHEYMLKCFERHPYLWGTYVWNMFDFAADARNQGGEPGMNHKGMVTFDRKIKKDSFYLYKAFWSEEPFVHIASKRFVYRDEAFITVKVYSNRKEVTLYLDDRKLETLKGERIFEFKNVPISECTGVKAVSGELSDTAEFRYSKIAYNEYKLNKNKNGTASNWT